jgi:hypothetical protein
MQDPGCEPPRISLLRGWVNKAVLTVAGIGGHSAPFVLSLDPVAAEAANDGLRDGSLAEPSLRAPRRERVGCH